MIREDLRSGPRETNIHFAVSPYWNCVGLLCMNLWWYNVLALVYRYISKSIYFKVYIQLMKQWDLEKAFESSSLGRCNKVTDQLSSHCWTLYCKSPKKNIYVKKLSTINKTYLEATQSWSTNNINERIVRRCLSITWSKLF